MRTAVSVIPFPVEAEIQVPLIAKQPFERSMPFPNVEEAVVEMMFKALAENAPVVDALPPSSTLKSVVDA